MLVRQNSSRVMVCCIDMLVLYGSVGSCNFCLIICMDGVTGTDVKRALTSKEVMTSPGSSLLPCNSWMKCWVLLRWWGDWPTRGLMM